MTHNVGKLDRWLRLIAGVALLIVFVAYFGSGWALLALILGVVALATAAVGSCPAYSLFGIRTCQLKQ